MPVTIKVLPMPSVGVDADFFCLQETKMQEGQLDAQFEGYRSYWNYAERKVIRAQLFFLVSNLFR